jgi:hypothetical protein
MTLSPAAHDDELAVLGPCLTSGNRRVDPADTRRTGDFGQLTRDNCRNRGVIDEDAALGHARQRAILAQHHRAQIVIIADAGHDELRARRGLAAGWPRNRRHAR